MEKKGARPVRGGPSRESLPRDPAQKENLNPSLADQGRNRVSHLP